MAVSLIRGPHIDQIWPLIAEGLHNALLKTGGDVSLGYLWSECAAGRAFLYVYGTETADGAAIFRPETWLTGEKLRVLALYGDEQATVEFLELARNLARAVGASSFVAEARDGWPRHPTAKGLKVKKLRTLYEVPV